MEDRRATLTVNFEWTKTTGWIFNTEGGLAIALFGVREESEVLDTIAELFDALCIRMDEVIGSPFEIERGEAWPR